MSLKCFLLCNTINTGQPYKLTLAHTRKLKLSMYTCTRSSYTWPLTLSNKVHLEFINKNTVTFG